MYQIYNRPTGKQRAVLACVYADRRRFSSVFDRHGFFRGVPWAPVLQEGGEEFELMDYPGSSLSTAPPPRGGVCLT